MTDFAASVAPQSAFDQLDDDKIGNGDSAEEHEVRVGLVRSLSRPGGNVTGLALQLPELTAKRLQLPGEMLPGVARVAVLWNSAAPQKEVELKAVQATARGLGMSLQLLGVRSAAEIDSRFEEARAGGLIVVTDPLTLLHRTRIVHDERCQRGLAIPVPNPRRQMNSGSLLPKTGSLQEE